MPIDRPFIDSKGARGWENRQARLAGVVPNREAKLKNSIRFEAPAGYAKIRVWIGARKKPVYITRQYGLKLAAWLMDNCK